MVFSLSFLVNQMGNAQSLYRSDLTNGPDLVSGAGVAPSGHAEGPGGSLAPIQLGRGKGVWPGLSPNIWGERDLA